MPVPVIAKPPEGDAPVDRVAILSEMESLKEEAVPEENLSGDEPAPESESKAEAEVESKPEDKGEDTEEAPPDAKPEEKAAEPEPEKADSRIAKSLETIRKAENRAKAAILQERQKFEEERASWAPRIEAAKQFEAMKDRVKIDPAGVLASLGVDADNFEYIAQQVYLRSKAAAAKPELREKAERTMREREMTERIEAAEKRAKALEDQMKLREAQANEARQVEAYLGSVEKAVDNSAPIVQSMLTKNPGKARELMHAVAVNILQQTGEVPEPSDVIQALEQWRRAELEEAGIDPASLVKKPETKAPQTPPASEKKLAKGISNDLGTPTATHTTKSREEELGELRRDLETGRFV